MGDEEIILYLIQQELKFSQLKDGMRRVGFETHVHNVSLLEVIVAMIVSPMGNRQEYYEVLEGVGDLYNDCLDEAVNYPISILGNELEPLAHKAYKSIRAYLRTR